MTDGFDATPEADDDGIFFAGIGAEDPAEELGEDEDASLANTVVRPDDDQPGGPGMVPLLGAGVGAGGIGAVGLGTYVSGTRADSRSREGGTSAPVGGAVSFTDVPDQAHGLHVDADGRVRSEDPWGVAAVEDLPGWMSTSSEEAPRTSGGSGTRGSHLARSEAAGGGTMAPGATLGGIGGLQGGGQQVAATATSGSQSGGIPLSVLQNLQSGKATGAAFSPPATGVSAAGTGAYHGDPALLVSQALAASDVEGVQSGEDWLEARLRLESGRGDGVSGIIPGLRDDGDAEDEQDSDEQGDRRRTPAIAAGAVGVVGAGGIGAWRTGSPTSSGQAPTTGGGMETGAGIEPPSQSSWGWNTGSGNTTPGGFTGSYADSGVKPADGAGFTPATGGNHGGGAPGITPGPGTEGAAAPSVRGDGQVPTPGVGGPSGSISTTPTPTAGGTDFTVSQDALGTDAEQWRRLSTEMDEVHTSTRAIRDGESSFGLVQEPARAYSSATWQAQRWASQAAHAYEGLAMQLNATAALYRANEHTAIDGTGRVFEA